MDKILERIIETDRQARERVRAERQHLEAINDEIAAEKAEIDRSLSKAAEKEIAATKQRMEEKLNAETARIDSSFSATRDALNKKYEEYHDEWVREITDEVTR